MSVLLILLIAIALLVVLSDTSKRMRRLEARVRELERAAAEAAALPESGQPPPAAPAPEDCPVTGASRWSSVLAKLPFWVGATALVGGVVFLLAFSIGGLFLADPGVRVALGGGLGLAFLGAGTSRRVPSRDVAEGLQAAGIGTLYAATISACTLHGLIPPGLAFAVVAAVSALAFWLSSRGGSLVAYVGVAGGFLTPLLIRTPDPSPWLMLGYLVALSATTGGLALAKGRGGLGAAAVGGCALWTAVFALAVPGGATAPGVLLAAYFWILALAMREACPPPRSLADAVGPLPATALAALAFVAAALHGSGLAVPALGGIAACSLLLASRRSEFDELPAVAYAAGMAAATLIRPGSALVVPLLLALCLAFGAVPALLARRPALGRAWSVGSPVALLGVMAAFGATKHEALGGAGWGFLSLGAALGYAALARAREPAGRPLARPDGIGPDDAFVAAAWGFGALALVQFAGGAAWSWCALALAAAASVAFDTRTPTAAMPRMSALLAGAAAAPCLPAIGAPQLHADPVTGLAFPIVGTAVAAALLWASRLSRGVPGGERDLPAFWLLQCVAGVSAMAAAYSAARWLGAGLPAFPAPRGAWDGFGVALVPLALAIAGALLARLGRRGGEVGVEAVGRIGATFAEAWVVLVSMVLLSPLLARLPVGDLPLLNAVPLLYGVPAALLVASALRPGWPRSHIGLGGAVALGFLCVTCLVRQAFHGTVLAGHPLGQGETWAYTAAWLAYAAAVLAAGVSRRSRILCDGGMLLMMLCGAKLFVWDAFWLGGLWRVVAFIGFGLALMALGHFYHRLGDRLARGPRVGG